MRRLGAWLRENPARLYLLVMALLLSNISVLLLGPQPPLLSLLVATVVTIFVLAYAWRKGGRSAGGAVVRRQGDRAILPYASVIICGGLTGAIVSVFFPIIFGNRMVVFALAVFLFLCAIASLVIAVWEVGRQ